jgi:hypothetical protein
MSFRAALFFIFAALLTLMSNLPAVGGNFTLSHVQTSPQGSRSQQMLSVSPGGFLTPQTGDADKEMRVKRQKGVGGNFTLSEIQTSPKGSRSQQMISVSPGGTQRTGTLFLTPTNGDADKESRVKRQKGNSDKKRRLSQSLQFKESYAAAQKKYRVSLNCLCDATVLIYQYLCFTVSDAMGY